MFEQVCREVRIRKENGLPLIPVSVNFSRQDFDHTDVVSRMNEIYEKSGAAQYVDRSYFIVEITEQLRGTADKRQVDGAKYGLAQSVGGIGSAVTVSILEAI